MSRRITVLSGIAVGAGLAAITRASWARAVGPDLTGTGQGVEVLGSDAAPAVLALALVAIAASVASALSSRWVRFVTGPVLILAGAGAVVSSLSVVTDAESSSRAAVAQATGVIGGGLEAEATAWPLIALVPALGVVATGAVVLLRGGRWPVGRRYRSAAVALPAEPDDPAHDPAAAWDALTRGEDPSLTGTAEGDDAAEDDDDVAE